MIHKVEITPEQKAIDEKIDIFFAGDARARNITEAEIAADDDHFSAVYYMAEQYISDKYPENLKWWEIPVGDTGLKAVRPEILLMRSQIEILRGTLIKAGAEVPEFTEKFPWNW